MAGVSSKLFNKRTAVLLGGAAVIAIAAAWAFWLSAPSGPGPQVSASSAPEGYILDKTFDLSLEDIKKSRGAARPGEFNTGTAQADAAGYTTGSGEAGARDYMTENLGVSVFTRKYFKYLEKQFKHSPDLETHLAEVRDYLFSQLPEDEALEFFNLYKKYLDCEMELAQLLPSWGRPADLEGQLALLARVQEFRRDALGRDAADALFGADVKTKEYALRRAAMAYAVSGSSASRFFLFVVPAQEVVPQSKDGGTPGFLFQTPEPVQKTGGSRLRHSLLRGHDGVWERGLFHPRLI